MSKNCFKCSLECLAHETTLACDHCSKNVHVVCYFEFNDVDAVQEYEEADVICSACEKVIVNLVNSPSKDALDKITSKIVPQNGWGIQFPSTINLPEEYTLPMQMEKKKRNEAYTLFMDGHITTLQTVQKGRIWWFKAVAEAAQKTKQGYTVFTAIKVFSDEERPSQKIWGYCSCPAGVVGTCKHAIALLFKIMSIERTGATVIEMDFDAPTPTGRLQMWHVRKPTSDEPLLFAEIGFVKHQEAKSGYFRSVLGSEILRHKLLPASRSTLSRESVIKLVDGLKHAGSNFPVLENIKMNDFQPRIPKHRTDDKVECLLIDELFALMQTDTEHASKIIPDNQLQESFLEIIALDWDESQQLERITRYQSQSSAWYKSRLFRITASIVHTIVNKNARTDPVKRFQSKRKNFSSKSCRHGLQNEAAAFRAFLAEFNSKETKKIEGNTAVGLLVHPNFNFCGASLDRLIKVEGVLYPVEIKCPYNPYVRKQKLRFKLKDKSFYVNIDSNGNLFLNNKHPYFSQVQMQLLVSNSVAAYFVLYIPPDDVIYLKVERDNNFISNMLQASADIYKKHLLPAFAEEVSKDV